MAIANVLAIGTTAANSADVVVANGATLSVSLKQTGGGVIARGAIVKITRKDDLGGYNYVSSLGPSRVTRVLAEGTYRFERKAGVSVGVFSG